MKTEEIMEIYKKQELETIYSINSIYSSIVISKKPKKVEGNYFIILHVYHNLRNGAYI